MDPVERIEAGRAADFLEPFVDESERAPKPERVSDAFADERIREKIERFREEKPRAGLRRVDHALKARHVPAAMRLHLVTAVVNLGRIAEESLDARRGRSDARESFVEARSSSDAP